MSRKNSPNKHISPNSNFKPESYFDRLILMYDCKSEEGMLKLEKYMLDRQATIKHRPYVAIKKSMEKNFVILLMNTGKCTGGSLSGKSFFVRIQRMSKRLKNKNP